VVDLSGELQALANLVIVCSIRPQLSIFLAVKKKKKFQHSSSVKQIDDVIEV